MSWDYRSIMSGQRKDPLAIVFRGGLWMTSLGYRMAITTRNRRYDSGRKAIHRHEAFVISVGNLTTGGTGKTPIICYLAKWLRARGLRVAIVSRGYGRGESDFNDEAMELHDRLPDVPHVQDADRVEAARVAIEELESEIILMDDGFQHRRLHRDLDLVVIDATCPFGFGHLLPRGLLREPIKGLKRAGLVMLTRCDLVEASTLTDIEQAISAVHPGIPVVRCQHRPTSLLATPDTTISIDSLIHSRVAVVSAIGNPTAFEQTIRDCGGEIVASRRLPDHDPYDPETVVEIRHWIQTMSEEIDQVICTHKDLVKLGCDRLGGKPLRALLIELTIDAGSEHLEKALQNLVGTQQGSD